VQCCHLPLTSPVISPLFLMRKWQVRVISLRMWLTTIKLFYQMNSHGILVVFIVLFTKHPKLLTNTRTPYALVRMMAAHTAFHNELVTRGSGCTWSLCHVHVHWDVLTGIDRPFYWSLLIGIDGPIRFKTSQLRSYQIPKRENYTSNNRYDFPLV